MTETLPAIRKKVSVPLQAESAFEVFTAAIADWWPLASHSLSASEGKAALGLALDPRAGGQITETRHDGAEAAWGTISIWEPGRRLGLDWFVGRSPQQASRIVVTFTPAGTPAGAGTEVSLFHDRFERLGSAGEAAAASYEEGWDHVLGDCYRRACESRT